MHLCDVRGILLGTDGMARPIHVMSFSFFVFSSSFMTICMTLYLRSNALLLLIPLCDSTCFLTFSFVSFFNLPLVVSFNAINIFKSSVIESFQENAATTLFYLSTLDVSQMFIFNVDLCKVCSRTVCVSVQCACTKKLHGRARSKRMKEMPECRA